MNNEIKITGTDIDIICRNSETKYMFLASLISSDNILTIKDAEKSLSFISQIEKALDTASISDAEKDEIKKYLEKGKSILNADIERFKEN